MQIEENVPLAPLTSLEVGGPARFLTRCRSVADLRAALAVARARRLDTFVLGGGSNLLVADAGFDGLVIRIEDELLRFEAAGDNAVVVRAGAGLEWDALVAAAVADGLAGVECLSGIPGRVGAAPIQNIGAYGQEVAETLVTVHTVELATGGERTFTAADCGFGYRTSRFKGSGRHAVIGVDLRLERRGSAPVRYGELERRFGPGSQPPLEELRTAVLEIRRGKSMLLDGEDPNRRSAGSFFLNPVVSAAAEAEAVRRRLAAAPGEMPAHAVPGGGVKLSAAWLIERCGFQRGEGHGRAAISSRHSLAIVNTGGARASEIIDLAARIRCRVREMTGVILCPEPVFLGFGTTAGALLDKVVGSGL